MGDQVRTRLMSKVASSGPSSPAGPATRLDDLASDSGIAENKKGPLAELARALRTGTDLDKWAGVNLRSAFAPDTTINQSSALDWLGRGLEVLVFLPVTITWFGLVEASHAYRETLGYASLARESFLQRWQTGFGGRLPSWFSFDHIAFYSFCSVTLILIVAAGRLFLSGGRRQYLERQLDSALIEADLVLGPIRVGAHARMTAELGKVSAEIATAATAVREAGQFAGNVQQQAQASLKTAAEALTRVEASVAAAEAATTESRDSVNRPGRAYSWSRPGGSWTLRGGSATHRCGRGCGPPVDQRG